MRFAAALAGLLLALAAAPAAASGEECLACHAQQGLTKTLDKGETLPLHVPAEAFAGSVHAPLGCTGCHATIDPKQHPGKTRNFATARDYALQATEACKSCHEPIFNAYLGSTHGKARENGAPLCADCHKPHEITRAALAVPKDTCVACHATAADAHQKWLPNAAHHFEVVACAACHSPTAKTKVDLRLFDASGKEVLTGGPALGNEPLDEKRLWQFVRGASRDAKVTLVGRLEVADPAQAHAIAPGAKAVKDCTTCHRKGAEAFENVTLSIVGPDGRRARYDAHKEVLHAPTSVDSVRGFYAIGGTRIHLLDVVLALALIGGISAPIAHLVMRRILRRKKEKDHA